MIEVSLIIFWLGFVLYTCLNKDWRGDERVIAWLLTGMIVFFAEILPYALGEMFPVEFSRTNQTQVIYSARNADGVEGRFYLGSGFIESTEYYYMFSKQSDGGFYRVKLRSGDCVVYQNNGTPHLEWQRIYYTYPKWAVWWPQNVWTRDSIYSVIVPTNTIVEQFRLN